MKLETFRQQTTEVFVEDKSLTVSAYPWANHEGGSVLVHGPDLAQRTAFSLRWEELDVLLVALQAARAT